MQLTSGQSQGRDGAKVPGTYGEAETSEPKNGRRVKNDFIVTALSVFCGAKGSINGDTVRGMSVCLLK